MDHAIYQRGRHKTFAKNARKRDVSMSLAGWTRLRILVLMAEGYATTRSITEATNMPTVAAFDSGNLEPVAKST
ncbi:hypothetical protein [Enterobacter kobei]|uniref:hypothetical protein n=1 Tax=Enterobacter kobei TaxID=208224 RepID=UPI00388DF0F4